MENLCRRRAANDRHWCGRTASDLEALTSRWPLHGDVHEAHVAAQTDGRTEYLVAWSDGAPVGCAVIRWDGCGGARARAAHPEAVEICHLQVRPEHRGQGAGSALIAAAEARAHARGRLATAVGVSDDNPDAQRLYERLGYRQTGIVDVTEYDWCDDEGAVHHAREHDQLLIKRL